MVSGRPLRAGTGTGYDGRVRAGGIGYDGRVRVHTYIFFSASALTLG